MTTPRTHSTRLGTTFLAAVLLALGCQSSPAADDPTSSDPVSRDPVQQDRSELARDTDPTVPDTDFAAQMAANGDFAFDMYRQVAGDEAGNLVLGPVSLSSALAMTYAGAAGTTAAEMAASLHFALAPDKLHPAFNRLDLELRSRNLSKDTDPRKRSLELNLANSLWVQRDLPLLAPFLDTLAQSYDAGVYRADFEDDAEGARCDINDEVATATHERIQELLPPLSLNEITKAVLVNSLYFNASWLAEFYEDQTNNENFTLANGQVVSVPTMRSTMGLSYAWREDVETLRLPFVGGQIEMLLLLPAPDKLQELEHTLDAAKLATLSAATAVTDIALYLPKWKQETPSLSLKRLFKKLGMQTPFDRDSADFSAITTQLHLMWISEIFHKVFIDVKETGVEAAAASAVVISGDSGGDIPTSPPEPPTVVRFDRPFLDVVRDVPTGAILFLGRVADPAQ